MPKLHSIPCLTPTCALILALGGLAVSGCQEDCESPLGPGGPDIEVDFIEVNDNGAWSWFMSSRAIVSEGKLIVGSVRAVGKAREDKGAEGWGNVEVSTLDIETGAVGTSVLYPQFEQDDHDAPSLLPLPDGRILAAYAIHGLERVVYTQHSEVGDPLSWGAAQEFVTPGVDSGFGGDNVTYANLFRFPGGRIYNFYRGYESDPNYMYSDDEGETWTYGGRLMEGFDGYAPYLRYAYDGAGTLHFMATEDHPRHYDNSIYHGYLQGGVIHDSSGAPIAELSETTGANLSVLDLSLVYAGDEDHVAWTVDIELDAERLPYLAFSTQRDGAGVPFFGGAGQDMRYHYGRWDGESWSHEEIAYAGTHLYPREEDYTGLAALDPTNPNVIYISTDAEPTTGEALISEADCRRHYELFRGTRSDSGWTWESITANSEVDNLRPIVPEWEDERTALVWMRGTYVRAHGEWTTAVTAAILP